MDAEQLAQARENYYDNLPDTAEIWTERRISDGAGGGTSKARLLQAGLRARAATMRQPRTSEEGGRIVVRADWRVQLAHKTIAPDQIDLIAGDTIRLTSRGGTVTSFRVHATSGAASDRVCLTVDCKRAE